MTQGIGDAISAGDSAVLLEPLAPGAPGAKAIRGRSPFALAFDRLRRDRGAMISLGVIILIVLIAIAAPLFASLARPPAQPSVPHPRCVVGEWPTARAEFTLPRRHR